MDDIWNGLIFIRHEGGYKVVLRALQHYKKRLKTISQSPELAGAAMFSQIVQQEAAKTYPVIDELIVKISQCLADSEQLDDLQTSVPMLQKALESYRSDIDRAERGEHEYYRRLIDITALPDDEIQTVKDAIARM